MSLMQMSVTGSCLIAAIAVFRCLFFRRLPKRTLVWLWIAAALVLLIPVRLSAPWSVYGLLPAASVTGGTAAAAAPGVSAWTGIRMGISISLALCLAVAYGAGLARFYRGRIVREPWAERWLCDHPLRRYLTIRESEQITAPISGGILRPVILLPAGRAWDEETRRCVLAHEYTHVRRLDGLVKLLYAAAVCIHWFNPLTWLMAVLVCRDLEFACDEAVLSGGTGRADYARAMLQVEAERGARPLFASGFGAATVRRMEAVARFRRPGAALRAVSLLAAAVLVAVFATSPLRPREAPVAGGQYMSNVNTDRSSAGPEAAPKGVWASGEQSGKYVRVTGYGEWQEITIQDGATVRCIIVPTQSDTSEVLLLTEDGAARTQIVFWEEDRVEAEKDEAEKRFTARFSIQP